MNNITITNYISKKAVELRIQNKINITFCQDKGFLIEKNNGIVTKFDQTIEDFTKFASNLPKVYAECIYEKYSDFINVTYDISTEQEIKLKGNYQIAKTKELCLLVVEEIVEADDSKRIFYEKVKYEIKKIK